MLRALNALFAARNASRSWSVTCTALQQMATTRQSTLPVAHLAAAQTHERLDARYKLSIPIEVIGISAKRRLFHELTHTKDLSAWGCSFSLSVKLQRHDIVVLRVVGNKEAPAQSHRRSMFQVLRSQRAGRVWLIGAWKLDDRDLWGAILQGLTPEVGGRKLRQSDRPQVRKRQNKSGHGN
jgi:hypothetical protein